MKKLKYWIIAGVILIIGLILYFLPGYLKSYLEDNSKELIGRKLTLKELHLNYLTVSMQVNDLVLYELNETDSFVAFDSLQVNLNPWTLFRSELTITSFHLVSPKIALIQDENTFNFDDLLAEDTTQTTEEPADTSTFRYTIQNISINTGKISYRDVPYQTSLIMNNLNIDVPIISWDSRQSAAQIAFEIGNAGKIQLDAKIAQTEGTFSIGVKTQQVDLSLIKNYLRDYIDFQSIAGLIDADLTIQGETEHVADFTIAGDVSIKQIDIVDGLSNPILKADEFFTNLELIDMTHSVYQFKIMELKNADMQIVMDKENINLMHFINPYMISPVDSTDTTTTRYRIDKMIVENSRLKFEDRTLNRPFVYELKDVNLSMIDFTESATAVPLSVRMSTNTDGTFSSDIIFDWLTLESMDIALQIKKLGLMNFSPYSEYFIASPITQGNMNYSMKVKLSPTKLDNTNSIVINELEMGKKTKDTTAVKVPIKLGLYLIKDKNDKIAIDLPITGNPNAPKFSYKKLIWQVVSNFFIKTAAAPFKALAGLTGKDPEKLDKINFEFAMDSLVSHQTETLDDIASILAQKPELIFQFAQFTDPEEEMKVIAVQEAKKAYQLSLAAADTLPGSESKSKEITGYGVQFIEWLRTKIPGSETMNMEEMCMKFTSKAQLHEKLQATIAARDAFVKQYLLDIKKLSPDHIQFLKTDYSNIPEELRKPHFKIEVSID